MMENFPSEKDILEFEPEELAPFVLRYLVSYGAGNGSLNRDNFAQALPRNFVGERMMEAWMWLEREGMLVPQPGYTGSSWVFITERGRAVSLQENFDAYLKGAIFPPSLDPVLVRAVKPLFMRGDYDTAVFRAFKEVEVRVRERSKLDNSAYGRDLMIKAFGPTGPMTDRLALKGEQDALRELFSGALSAFKNPSSHREVQFDDPQEVANLISFANQLLRIVGRIQPSI